jgi:hypothetical protein
LSERRGALRNTDWTASVNAAMTPPAAPATIPLSVPPAVSAARR